MSEKLVELRVTVYVTETTCDGCGVEWHPEERDILEIKRRAQPKSPEDPAYSSPKFVLCADVHRKPVFAQMKGPGGAPIDLCVPCYLEITACVESIAPGAHDA